MQRRDSQPCALRRHHCSPGSALSCATLSSTVLPSVMAYTAGPTLPTTAARRRDVLPVPGGRGAPVIACRSATPCCLADSCAGPLAPAVATATPAGCTRSCTITRSAANLAGWWVPGGGGTAAAAKCPASRSSSWADAQLPSRSAPVLHPGSMGCASARQTGYRRGLCSVAAALLQ